MLIHWQATLYLNPMKPRYREDKATQVAALLLQLSGGTINHTKLITLMYFVERSAVVQFGRPVTFDDFLYLERRPVLVATLDNVNGDQSPNVESYWLEHVSKCDGSGAVHLKSEVACNDQLSRAEETITKQIFAEFGQMDLSQLRDYAHHNFSELKDSSSTRYPIAIREILLAEGYSDAFADEVEQDLRGEALVGHLE